MKYWGKMCLGKIQFINDHLREIPPSHQSIKYTYTGLANLGRGHFKINLRYLLNGNVSKCKLKFEKRKSWPKMAKIRKTEEKEIW